MSTIKVLLSKSRSGALTGLCCLGALGLLSQDSYAGDSHGRHHHHHRSRWVSQGPMFFERHQEEEHAEEGEGEEGEGTEGSAEEGEGAEEEEHAEVGDPMVGSFTFLRRSVDHVDYLVRVTQLLPGHVYTLNAVIFNNPEECLGNEEHPQFRCSRDDFLNGRGGYSAINLGGKNLVEGSSITFRGRRNVGDPERILAGDGGLKDALGAEVMFDLWDMGRPIPELLEQQLTTRSAGCGVGEPNDNGGLCIDLAGNAI